MSSSFYPEDLIVKPLQKQESGVEKLFVMSSSCGRRKSSSTQTKLKNIPFTSRVKPPSSLKISVIFVFSVRVRNSSVWPLK